MERESITKIIALSVYDSAASVSKIESKNTKAQSKNRYVTAPVIN